MRREGWSNGDRLRAEGEVMTVRHNATFLGLLLLLPAAGCGTATIDDAVPAAAFERPAVQPSATPDAFPNLNVAPVTAAAQITDEERDATAAELRARRDRLTGRTSPAPTTRRDLQSIGERHGQNTLNEIEQQ